MHKFAEAIRSFQEDRRAERESSLQLAALQLVCGMDLEAVLSADRETRRAGLMRLDRMVERERLRGLARHWSYDLNRHIALKQACDRLRRSVENAEGGAATPPSTIR